MANILVLCTGNSCRSQMAEGYLRAFADKKHHIYSAGITVHGLNPNAVSIMAEDDIDISMHTSNHLDEYQHIAFDYILTVCDHANEHCPVFPSTAQKLHYNFPDPAKAKGTENEILDTFRFTRDKIKVYIQHFVTKHLKT